MEATLDRGGGGILDISNDPSYNVNILEFNRITFSILLYKTTLDSDYSLLYSIVFNLEQFDICIAFDY